MAMAQDRLTTADAAKIAGVATSTIKRWADQGLLPFTRTAGGHEPDYGTRLTSWDAMFDKITPHEAKR